MTDRELEGVIAHELGHVLHRDILTSTVAATLASAITFLARMAFWFGPRRDDDDEGGGWGGILMMILAPLAAALIQMAISRSREFELTPTRRPPNTRVRPTSSLAPSVNWKAAWPGFRWTTPPPRRLTCLS